ncbi:MAG: hypothetical protein OQK98_03065 [Gammaproteobacteria bacterium]|nr:hypothetical protein [Gammaproteobacteria bacterium]
MSLKRCAAIEILLNSPRVEELIKKGEVAEIKEVMEKSERMGMRTFDSALLALYKDGKISVEEVLKNTDSENNLRLKIEPGEDSPGISEPKEDAFGGLSLMEKEVVEEEEVYSEISSLAVEEEKLPDLET